MVGGRAACLFMRKSDLGLKHKFFFNFPESCVRLWVFEIEFVQLYIKRVSVMVVVQGREYGSGPLTGPQALEMAKELLVRQLREIFVGKELRLLVRYRGESKLHVWT